MSLWTLLCIYTLEPGGLDLAINPEVPRDGVVDQGENTPCQAGEVQGETTLLNSGYKFWEGGGAEARG